MRLRPPFDEHSHPQLLISLPLPPVLPRSVAELRENGLLFGCYAAGSVFVVFLLSLAVAELRELVNALRGPPPGFGCVPDLPCVLPGAEPLLAEAEAQPQAAAQAATAEAQAQGAATEAEAAAAATEAEAKAASTERALFRNSTQSVAVDYLAKLWLFTTALLAVATSGY